MARRFKRGSGGPDYEVGFRKPPKSGQFMKGVSGNPKGRPAGSLNLQTIVENELAAKIPITENGKRKSISKGEALVKQLINSGLSGKLRAVADALALWAAIGTPADPDKPITESQQEVLKLLLAKFHKYQEKPS